MAFDGREIRRRDICQRVTIVKHQRYLSLRFHRRGNICSRVPRTANGEFLESGVSSLVYKSIDLLLCTQCIEYLELVLNDALF